MDAGTRSTVRNRARHRCEYCGLAQEAVPFFLFHIEHIIARQHGGTDDLSNLALACQSCNYHKGPNIAGIDPVTHTLQALFNPRTQIWDEHFRKVGASIAGLTPVGRTTVRLLAMNSDDLCRLRSELELE